MRKERNRKFESKNRKTGEKNPKAKTNLKSQKISEPYLRIEFPSSQQKTSTLVL